MAAQSPTGILAKWAYYSSQMRHSGGRRASSWESARRMIDALKNRAEPEAARLRRYLRQSNEILRPLGEPLLIDFGLHRWLKEEREEAYSDWLAWIVGQLSDTPE